MKIRVEYYAHLRAAAGVSAEEVELSTAVSLAALLRLLADRHGEAMQRALLTADDRPQPGLMIAIGDRILEPSQQPALSDGDTLTILPAISGG